MEKEDMVRDSILGAAEKLFQKWGINKTTMDDIAREAGKGKGSIYYYYKNKDAVLEAVAMCQADRITDIVRIETEKKITAREKLLVYVYTTFYETRRAVTLYEIARGEIRANRDLIRKIMDRFYISQSEIVERIILLGSEKKEFRSIGGRDVKDAARAIVTVMRSLIMDLCIEQDDKRLIDRIIDLLSEGL